MPYGRTRLWATLRFRLTLWNTLGLLVLVSGSLIAVREGVRLSLWNEADAQLVEDAHEIRLTFEQLYPDTQRIEAELNRKAISHTHRGLYVRFYDEELTELWKSVNSPRTIYPISELSRFEMTPVSAGQHRLLHLRLARPSLPAWVIRVGTSFEPLNESVAHVTRLLLIVGGGVLLVTPIGGYWLAGRATRPVAEIIRTTASLQPTRMDQRLPLRGTGDELDRVSSTINGFLDRIAAYIHQNQTFTANAAHELRSPLAAIQSSLEVALSANRSDDEYREILGTVLDECEHLRVLVSHLLLLAEGDAGFSQKPEEAVPLDRIVKQSYDVFLALAESRDIALDLGRCDPVVVNGRSGNLRQVIGNLLDNALKFTPAGGRVELSLTAEGDSGVLVVQDTGEGIPSEDLPHLFARFYRGDRARVRDGRSTGLGLSICQSIVQAHGGQIALESSPGQGTRVTVSLPASTGTIAGGTPALVQR